MRFSIIIPLYNCEQYIDDCIKSVQKQTYQDFEIIVVNDGSTDGSLHRVKNIEDERIKIISQKNKGLFHARLSGLKVAMGDYCLFLDADDLLCHEVLELLAAQFNNGYDCVMYKTVLFYDEQPDELILQKGALADGQTFDKSTKLDLIEILLTSAKLNSIVCKAFKRNMINVDKLESYPRIAIGEDALFTMELFENIVSAVYLDRGLYLYRQQPESMTHNLTINIYYDNIFRFKKYHEMADMYFGGAKLSVVCSRIVDITCRMVSSMALNSKYAVSGYAEYRQIIESIAEDAYFKTLRNQARYCRFLYRTVLFCIERKWFLPLYYVRCLNQCYRKFRRKLCVKN